MYALGLQMGLAAPHTIGSGLSLQRGVSGFCQHPCKISRYHQGRRKYQIAAVSREKKNGDELSPQEFFESFLRRRQSDGDFVSKASDVLWKKDVPEFDEEKRNEVREKLAELQKMKEVEDTGSYLKLTKAKNWTAGLEEAAPANINSAYEERARARDDRKRQSLLEYEALKREISLMTVGVAALCSLYCLVILSVESTVSYDIGAVFSLAYLQLLYRYTDNFTEDSVADIFIPKRFKKKIGITSGDVQETLEKTIRGSGMALSSPRLVLPAALYGVWAASTQFTGTSGFHLEVAPMMLGFFAYKAAALVQAYRDNRDLLFEFDKNVESK